MMMKTSLFILVLVVLVHRGRAVSPPDRCSDSDSKEQETNVWSETTGSCQSRAHEKPEVAIESGGIKCETFETTWYDWTFLIPQSGHIKFADKNEGIPLLSTWARGYTSIAIQVVFDEYNFNATDLNFTMHRVDDNKFPIAIDICWAIAYPGVTEKALSFGDEWSGEKIDVPPVTWFSTPSISETSENSFIILGREIHASQVHKLMQDVTKGKFPVTQTTSSDAPFELTIRGDIVYMDDDVTFQGLKKMEIYARKMVSNGITLNLTAPKVCDNIEAGHQCDFDNFNKADVGKDGIDGKSGIDSPVVGIYVHELLGDVKLVTRASNGTKGQDGGLGKNGTVKGEDGRKAGTSGHGGKASEVTLYVVNMTGRFTLNLLAGMGSPPAEHGYGGVRTGFPDVHNVEFKPACKENCKDDESMESVQLQTDDSIFSMFNGKDGFSIYPTPKYGVNGTISDANLNKVESIKTWFEKEVDLLQVIQRRGESLFLRNNKCEALEDFTFIKSVTDEDSEINRQASFRMDAITQGFDYYGNNEEYAPDLGWTSIQEVVQISLDSGKSFEDTYNQVMNKIDQFNQVKDIVSSIVTDSNKKAESQLNFEKDQLEHYIHVYVAALKTLERRMNISTEQIQHLAQEVINKMSKGQSIFKTVFDLVDVLSSIVGFVTKTYNKDIPGAMISLKQIVGAFSQQKKCQLPNLNQMTNTLEKRLKFGYQFNDIEPEDLDLSKMDVSAVPVILKSDLERNKGDLTQEFSCLLGGSGSASQNLNKEIQNFFSDAKLRINQIDQIIQNKIKIKNILHHLQVIKDSQAAVDAPETTSLSVKMQFTDLLFGLYQQQEAQIISSLYQLSKAYQFVSLWNYDIIDKYINNFGGQAMTNQLGSLNGMFHLQDLYQTLQNEKSLFLHYISSQAGPASHSLYTMWDFSVNSDPGMFKALHLYGQFTFRLNVDPNNDVINHCDNCYNGRLAAMYIELSGEPQTDNVPPRVFLRVVHMGDSGFLLPGKGGVGKTVVRFKETPGDTNGGNVMTFNMNRPVQSASDPDLRDILLQPENIFCQNQNSPTDYFGKKPCKSPYATYSVIVPKGDHECNFVVDGNNCKGLDLEKFVNIRVFAYIKSWSNYVTQEEFYAMREAGLLE